LGEHLAIAKEETLAKRVKNRQEAPWLEISQKMKPIAGLASVGWAIFPRAYWH